MATVYKFIEKDGVCIKTEKTNDISLYWIEQILGKVKVKGSKKEFEKIVIKNRFYGKDVDGIYIVERKYLTRDVVCSFITSYYNGIRSIQNHPYTRDLFDDELLDDLDIIVLTSKWFYRGNNKLSDDYCTYRKEDVNDKLMQEIKDNNAVQQKYYEDYNNQFSTFSVAKSKLKIKWSDCTR